MVAGSSVCNHDHPMIAFTSKSKGILASMQSSAVKILGADKKQVATPREPGWEKRSVASTLTFHSSTLPALFTFSSLFYAVSAIVSSQTFT